MAKIVEFPSINARKWAEWEREIRRVAHERGIAKDVTDDALPRLKAHWEAIFVAVDLEMPERPFPGTLTNQQGKAIQRLIDDAAAVVIERLRFERSVAFQRFVPVELALSQALLAR